MPSALAQATEREFDFDDLHFRFLAGLAHAKTGIVLPEQKRDMVYARLVRRLRALKLDSFADYCSLLQTEEGEGEIAHMINAITTNLTSFFRESHHFDHLREIAARHHAPRLRIWSAACSSGMEPYSIAMTLRAALPDIDNRDVKILATDIDSNMLAIGKAGEYTASDLDHLPAGYSRFTLPCANGRGRMREEIQRLISFKHLNLLGEWPMKGPFDAIFCRNVVIYFDKPTKQALFERMAAITLPGGYLYIGHSENLHGICDRFKPVGRTIYQRLP